MSQLIERLNRVARTAPQPMGFRAAQPISARSQMLLIASVGETENGPADRLSGADAVLVRVSKADARAMQKMVRSLPDVPWGVWLRHDAPEAASMVGAGADFVVFPAATAAAAIPRDNKLGRVLQVEAALGDGLLRAINDLPVDAVLLAAESSEGDLLTWQQLMTFQRAASLLTRPLLVLVPAKLSAVELESLWGIGVDGVVVEADKASLTELRQAIGSLPDSTRRKRGKAEALIPSVRMETPAETEEEEETEDE